MRSLARCARRWASRSGMRSPVYSAILRPRRKQIVAKQPLPLIGDLRIESPRARFRFIRQHCTRYGTARGSEQEEICYRTGSGSDRVPRSTKPLHPLATARGSVPSVTRHLRRNITHRFQLRERRQLLDRQTTDYELRSFRIKHNFEAEFLEFGESLGCLLSQPDLNLGLAVVN